MATAEKLLHEAYFAFNSISYGEAPGNKRNQRRATRLCHRILRKYPGTTEAAEAHAILMRLGDETYTSQLLQQTMQQAPRPADTPRQVSPRAPNRTQPSPQTFGTMDDRDVETLNWAGLVGWLVSLPRFLLAILLIGGFFLFGILGPLLFVPLILLVLFTGPFRGMLKPEQRRQIDDMVAWINRAIEEQRA